MKTGIITKILAWVVGIVVVAALLIQLVPFGSAGINPAVINEPDWNSSDTQALFMTTCGDCHSNETRWPWYSRVAPISWLVYRDVLEGRKSLMCRIGDRDARKPMRLPSWCCTEKCHCRST